VFTNRYLRAFAGEAATFNFFSTALTTVFLLYATRDLGMGPGVLGAVIASSSVGGLIGSLLAERAGRRLGLGPAIVAAMLLGTWPYLLVPLASGSGPASLAVLGAAFLSAGCGIGVSSVHVISLRQTITPDRLMGRMNASYRFVVWGTIAAGALLGGALGSAVGLRGAVLIAAVGIAAAPTWIILSPIRSLRTADQAATAAQPDEPLATGRA